MTDGRWKSHTGHLETILGHIFLLFFFDLLLLDTANILGFIHHMLKHYEALGVFHHVTAALPRPVVSDMHVSWQLRSRSSHVVQSNYTVIVISHSFR